MDKIYAWLATTPYKEYALSIASADASFREYFRLTKGDESVLLMDASLEKNSLKPFLDVTKRLLSAGVNAPKIYAQNLDEGFLILEDFGNTHYLNLLHVKNFQPLYAKAIDEILKMQNAEIAGLPLYDKAFLHFEMDLMQAWYLEKKLGFVLDAGQQKILSETLNAISKVVLSQPHNVFVHRDYHSRNIMMQNSGNIGVIDYQDAMCGAITYDLVSLLKDCYITFKREEIEDLALLFRDKKGLHVSDAEFLKWFDFMGLQRHIKVLGVFSRLHLRDGKEGYLKDIPLTLTYVLETAKRYQETEAFSQLLEELTSKR